MEGSRTAPVPLSICPGQQGCSKVCSQPQWVQKKNGHIILNVSPYRHIKGKAGSSDNPTASVSTALYNPTASSASQKQLVGNPCSLKGGPVPFGSLDWHSLNWLVLKIRLHFRPSHGSHTSVELSIIYLHCFQVFFLETTLTSPLAKDSPNWIKRALLGVMERSHPSCVRRQASPNLSGTLGPLPITVLRLCSLCPLRPGPMSAANAILCQHITESNRTGEVVF